MSKRTAALNLEWEQDGDDYVAQLPAIPGYPEMHDEESLVYVAPVGDGYTFWMEIAVLKSEFIKLTDLNFNLPNAKTADEMMQEVGSLTIQDILDALSAVGCGPIDATASRKATRRIASLNLDWSDQGIPQYEEAPLTFDIPGYEYDHAHSTVAITVRNYYSDTFGFAFDIAGLKSPRGEYAELWNDVDFGIPDGDTVEEMMRAAENITPQEIADALAANNYAPDDVDDDDVTASRHASDQPTLGLDWEHGDPASTLGDMGLDWTRSLDDYAEYEAYLPALPGYPEMGDKDSLVYVAPRDGEYTFWMDIAVMQSQIVTLTDRDFDIPSCGTADEMMQAVDSLTIQDILDALTAIGWGPDNGDALAASRNGSRRTADLGPLNWWGSNPDDTSATLPNIPGYSPRYGDTVAVYNAANPYMFINNQSPLTDEEKESGYTWAFDIQFGYPWGSGGVLTNEDFGIPYAASKEEMKDIVENLTVEEIVQAAEENGIEPYRE